MIVRRGYTARLGRINRIAFFAVGVVLPVLVTVAAAYRGDLPLAVGASVQVLLGIGHYYAVRHFTLAMDRRASSRVEAHAKSVLPAERRTT